MKSIAENGGRIGPKHKMKCGVIPASDDPRYLRSASEGVLIHIQESIRRGCVGDNYIHLDRFGTMMCSCDSLLEKRFQIFLEKGLCHECQVWYLEKSELSELSHRIKMSVCQVS